MKLNSIRIRHLVTLSVFNTLFMLSACMPKVAYAQFATLPLRDSSQTLPDGLYRLKVSGTTFSIEKNTASNGSFSTVTTPLQITSAAGVSITGANTTDGANFHWLQKIQDTTPFAFAAGIGGGLAFAGRYDSTNTAVFAGIQGIKENIFDGDYAGAIRFYTRSNGNALQEYARLGSSGIWTIRDSSGTKGIQFSHNGTDGIITTSSGALQIEPATHIVTLANGSGSFTLNVYGGATNNLTLFHDNSEGVLRTGQDQPLFLQVNGGAGGWVVEDSGQTYSLLPTTAGMFPDYTSISDIGSPFAWVRSIYLGTSLSFWNDTFLNRDAAGVLALKNADNAQGFNIYGATTGSKYLQMLHDGTNAHVATSSGTLYLGDASHLTKIMQSLAVPGFSNPGEAWIQCDGVLTVNRQCSINVNDSGTVYTQNIGAVH